MSSRVEQHQDAMVLGVNWYFLVCEVEEQFDAELRNLDWALWMQRHYDELTYVPYGGGAL